MTNSALKTTEFSEGVTHQGEVLTSGEGYDVIDCTTCGYKHVDPLPDAGETEELYRDTHYDDGVLDRIDYYERDRAWWLMNYGDVLNEIAAYSKPKENRTLLDIGCGAGIFMESAIEHGWNAVGVEISEIAARHCQKKGLNIIQESFSDQLTTLPENIDVIHIRNVLEHDPNPGALLELAYSKLEKGGLLVVAIPNDYNPIQLGLQKVRGTRPWWVTVPHHLNYFDYESLEKLVERCGFSVRSRFSSFPIDFFLAMGDNYVEEPSLGRTAHLRRVEFENFMQAAGLENTRRELYRSFARLDLGREAMVLATRE